MVSIIKNQILKHLSKFTKNLSPDQLNLSTFKGEGELRNLELNEDVLMDLLELPNWLRLTKAICNKVSIKVQWTKLKSVPIFISLDEVLVEMETCEELRQVSAQNTRPSYSSGGKYGFPDMVIDGITVAINNVEIKFRSAAFHASFQFSRVRLESRSPNWQRSDLKMTRLKDPDSGQLLIFKELEWQMLRIEAAATASSDATAEFTSPLRLITNQARCRITIKKRLQDCGILASRLCFIVDDLLWILTDTQIQAALHFLSSLSGLIRKSTEINKRVKAAHKIEFISMSNQSQMRQQHPSMNSNQPTNMLPHAFSVYDMIETSFHIYSSRIDLHFCDEASPGEGRSNHVLLAAGGAMQVTLTEMAFDYYPYHLASGGRKHWMRYGDLNTSCEVWMEQLMAAYKQQLLDIILGEMPSKKSVAHQHSISTSTDERRRSIGQSKATVVTTLLRRLMASCLVLRLGDFCVFQVTTTATKKKVPEKFFASDKNRLMLPSNLPAVHVEFADYFFPGDEDFPVPLANLHAHLNPVLLIVEPVTFLWLNAFASGLRMSTQDDCQTPVDSRPLDIRIEALMPRVVVEGAKEFLNQPSRPHSVQLHVSRLIATNSRIEDNCSRANLRKCLTVFQEGSLFSASGFPNKKDDLLPLSDAFGLHANCEDDLTSASSIKSVASLPKELSHADRRERLLDSSSSSSSLRRDMLWTENKSTWCVHLEPVWVDFCGMSNGATKTTRPVPFVDAVQATLWIVEDIVDPSDNRSDRDGGSSSPSNCTSSTHVLAQFKSLVSVQLNHYQYLFLLRSTELLTDLATNLAKDTESCEKSTKTKSSSNLCFAAILPEVDVSFLIPVNSPLPCGSDVATDMESVRDDLSSSTANTGVAGGGIGASDLDRVGGSTGNLREPANHVLMRESVSDNQIAHSNNTDRIGRRLRSSCSDYAINSGAAGEGCFLKVDGIGPAGVPLLSVTASDRHHPLNPYRNVAGSREHVDKKGGGGNKQTPIEAINIPAANNISATKPSSAVGSKQGNFQVTQTLAGLFGKQTPSMSMDSFTSPFLERTSLEKVPDNLGQTIATGSNAMRKGFSSLVASLDSALLNPNKAPSSTPLTSPLSFHEGQTSSTRASSRMTDDVETMSLCSDLSDSDNFTFLNSDDIFAVDENIFNTRTVDPSVSAVEVALEVKEDSSSEKSNSNSFKRQDLMKIIVFKMGNLEVIHESRSLNTVSKVQVHYVNSEDSGTMTWEEFQAKFSSSSRTWKEEAMKYTLPTSDVKIRFQRGPDVRHVCSEAVDRGFLEARVSDVTLSLLTSSIANLKDLLDDEIAPVAIPMNMTVSKLHLNLQEDCHSLENASADRPIPTVVDVHELVVSRTPDGVFHIIPSDMVADDGGGGGGDLSPVFDCMRLPSKDEEDPSMSVAEQRTRFGRRGQSASCNRSFVSVSEARIWARRSSLDDLEEKVFHLEEENEQLRLKLIAMETNQQQRNGDNVLKERDEHDQEVNKGQQTSAVSLLDEVRSLREEKASLLATLQLLQDELIASEKRASSASLKAANNFRAAH